MAVTIRLVTTADARVINHIFNHYVATSTCTYEQNPSSLEDRISWLGEHGDRYPVTVAELNGEIAGWAALSPFRRQTSYRATVENSVYVRHDLFRRGIGQQLLIDSIKRGKSASHHSIIAVIDGEQTASIALHRKHGFAEVGRLREAGCKFNRWLDVIYMQRML